MSEEQYWDKDPMLAKYFREADELRKERKNEELWLQGMYIYDAISRLSPILRPFAKKGTKAQPYPNEPYPIDEKTQEVAAKKQEEEQKQKAKRYMEAYMVKTNKYFKQKGSGDNGNNNRKP